MPKKIPNPIAHQTAPVDPTDAKEKIKNSNVQHQTAPKDPIDVEKSTDTRITAKSLKSKI